MAITVPVSARWRELNPHPHPDPSHHPAFGHPLPKGEGKQCTFSLWEKDRMRGLGREFPLRARTLLHAC